MRAKTVQCVRGGRLRSERTFFLSPQKMKVVWTKNTQFPQKNTLKKNMLDINLLRPEKGGDPVRFVATTFIPLSLLVVFVDVFLCSSSFRRRLRRAMMIGDDF